MATLVLFSVIGIAGWLKREESPESMQFVQEIALSESPKVISSLPLQEEKKLPAVTAPTLPVSEEDFPEVDRVYQLFALDSSKLPIVETVSYTSRVPWLKGRPAWIADYANYYSTSRHFIARSLNRKADYFTQKISPGDRFNVFKKDKNLRFHLLIDLSHSRMWLYYLDLDTNERMLLKTYRVGLGRPDGHKASGSLTPLGKYSLGDKIAIYKPGTMGVFQEKKTEMIRVFGTRWIPFESEVEGCTESARGFGIHGTPWMLDANGQLVEDLSKIGKYESDGCIRLASVDMEELFSIVITKPTVVEIVKDYREAKLPGHEIQIPSKGA